ncbi:MAG: chitobiase/beta-hexosaminidase C-terminal domain-containing protein [Prevotella sp.]|nr:chitobiase/beta-hexosaminidase C-terminal domain-containing protein [Prevotella sp.]
MAVMLLSLVMLFAGGSEVSAVQLASWTFEGGYDVSGNVYTPNSGTWAEVGATWFTAGAPQILADEAVGTQTDYVVTGKSSRYWLLCNGYNNHVFRIVNDTQANDISTPTDASTHDNYYEVQFPTTGYSNVRMSFACAYGGNQAATLTAVYSTDNGVTWKEAGTYTTADTWWTYNDGTLSFNAADRSKVIVRLLFGNGFKSNWNLDYVTITGDEVSYAPVYSWENPTATADGVVETGGSAVASDGESVNCVNSIYRVIRVSGPSDFSGNTIGVTLDNELDEGYIINVTGYRNKNAANKVSGALIKFANGTTTVSTGGGTEFVNIDTSDDSADDVNRGTTPNTISMFVPADAAGSKTMTLTRAAQGTNFFITKLEVLREKQALFITPSRRNGIAVGEGYTYGLMKGVDYDTDSEGALSFSSSNTSIATVDASGVITGVAAGIVDITITQAADGTYGAVERTIRVSVGNGRVYRDIRADFRNGAFLASSESGEVVTAGLKMNSDGLTYTRVEADDVSADAVITGKYHSDQHGLVNFSAVVPVGGPVKITAGTCAWGGNLTVTSKSTGATVAKTINTNNGACYHNNTTANVVVTYYSGGEDELVIAGGNYMPYLAVESITLDDIPTTINVTYVNGGDASITSQQLPATAEVEFNSEYTLPKNQTIYKEGYTLTGWSDGSNTYSPGQTITVGEDDITLTPVFRTNTKTLDALENNVTATWYFGESNGAPRVAWQNSGDQYLVTQSDVEGETQDMPLIVNTNGGKFNNARGDTWAQVNGGTKFIIPAVSGMKIEFMNFFSKPSGTITDGSISTDMTVAGTTMSYTYVGNAASVTVTVNEGSYGSGLIVTYPRLPKPEITGDLASSYTVRSGSPKTLKVEVSGATRYQWYKNTTASTTGATAISGATSATCTVAEPAEGEYYYLAATNSYGTVISNITTFRITTHTFDFTSWSDATKADLAAGKYSVTSTTSPSNNWSDAEKTSDTSGNDGQCYWQVAQEDGTLHANGNEIAELKGLVFQQADKATRNLAIAVDYPSTSLGTYHGGSYLWLGGADKEYFVIPSVKVGSVIRMGVESHNQSDARGVKLYVGSVEQRDADNNLVAVPTTFTEQEWVVRSTGNEEYVNVKVRNTNGCHIYYIDCDMAGFSMLNTSYVVKTGESYLLEAGTDYENVSGAPVTYTSGNTDLTTISSDGLIRMLRGGTVTITAHQDANGIYSASDQTFTVSSTNAQLEVSAEPLSLVINDAKVKYQTVKVSLTGTDFTPYSTASLAVSGSSANITVTPSSFKVENDGTISQQFTVTYATDAVDNGGTLTLTFTAEDKTKSISLPYGRSVAYDGTALSDVTGYRQWDWSGATADVLSISKDGQMAFADAEGTWPAGVTDAEGYYGGTQYLAGVGQYLSKTDGCFQGSELYFHNTVPGTIEVVFSNTGASERPYRYLNVNGVNTAFRSKTVDKVTSGLIKVPAGGVTIQGRFNDEEGDEITDSIGFGPQYLRIYKVTFSPNANAPVVTLDNDNATFTLATDDPDDVIYYTIDGTEPDAIDGIRYVPNLDDNQVDQGIHLDMNVTIKAIATNCKKNNSDVVSKTTKFKTYKLNVVSIPSRGGYVEYTPEAPNCSYTKGTKVSMRVIAKTGYGFLGWTETRAGDFYSTDFTDEITITDGTNERFVRFAQGPEGTVRYDFEHSFVLLRTFSDDTEVPEDISATKVVGEKEELALFGIEDKEDNLYNYGQDYSDFVIGSDKFLPDGLTSTSIGVPGNYGLYFPLGNAIMTLAYWLDADSLKENKQVRYELGENRFFASDGQEITLLPVFRYSGQQNTLDTRRSSANMMWDFRTGYGAQPMTLGSEEEFYYSTHCDIEARDGSDLTIDVPIKINTTAAKVIDMEGNKLTNEQVDTWMSLTEGTVITMPSGQNAQFTLATYQPILRGGTTINGRAPDNIDDEYITRNNDGAYLYTWTVPEVDLEATLVIGNDFSFYQYFSASLPDAEYQYLNFATNNASMGTVSVSPAGMETSRGLAYTNNASVTLSANRNKYYELKYWQDDEGYRYYVRDWDYDAQTGDYLHKAGQYTDADGNVLGTFSGKKINDVPYSWSSATPDELTIDMTKYISLSAFFGQKKFYYINFSAGGEAAGLPPYQQHVEWDEKFTMPSHNQHLYIEGYTLDYYTDRQGNRYDFGEQYLVTDEISVDGDLLLMPHFSVNTVSRGQLTTSSVVEWPLSAALGAPAIFYQNSMGLTVEQLDVNGTKIDLPLYINGSSGLVSNADQSSMVAERSCTVNKNAVFTLPVTSNCTIELHSDAGEIKSTTIAGTSTYTTKSSDGKTVTLDYTGVNADEQIKFAGDGGSRFTYVKVTYNPVSGQPELTGVTIDNTAVSAAELATLKSTTLLEKDYTPTYTGNSMPVVAATTTSNGTTVITQPTPANPVSTILLKTAGGVTVATYNIAFNVTGTTAPAVGAVTVNGSDAKNVTVTNVETKGVIAITLDHEPGSVTLADNTGLGQQMKAITDGNTLKFSYWDLEYGHTYTLTIPAGTLKDVYGEAYGQDVTITFTTKAEPDDVPHALYNFVVTHKQSFDAKTQTAGERIQILPDDVLANLDAKGIEYGTLDEGLAKANAAGGTDRYYIFVPDGEYQMKGTEMLNGEYGDYKDNSRTYLGSKYDANKKITVNDFYNGQSWVKRNNVSVVGQSQDSTIIFSDPYIHSISYTNTMGVSGKTENAYFQDFTVDNRYSQFQVDNNINPGDWAVAVYDRGIHSIWKNVTMKSYQDTYVSASNTSSTQGKSPGFFRTHCYYEDCSVWGTVDFICGSGDNWWERPVIVLRKRSTANNIVAASHASKYTSVGYVGADYLYDEPWGYVFNHAVIKCESSEASKLQNGNFYIGRCWQGSPAQTFLYPVYESTPASVGYTVMEKNLVCRMHEYGSMNADGTIADLTGRTLRAASPAAGSDDCILTASQAAEYTVHNVLGGDNAYDPTVFTKQVNLNGVVPIQTDAGISWTGSDQALCYVIFRLNEETGFFEFFDVTTETVFSPDDSQDGRVFYVRAANQRGGLGKPTKTVVFRKADTYILTVPHLSGLGEDDDDEEEWKGWSTICLGFNAKVPVSSINEDGTEGTGNITVYGTGTPSDNNKVLEGNVLHLKKVNYMVANCGYIVYATTGAKSKDYLFKKTWDLSNITNGSNSSILGGNPLDEDVAVGTVNCYTMAYKKTINPDCVGFYKFIGDEIPAHKAYLTVETLAKNGIVLETEAKLGNLSFVFEDMDETFCLYDISEEADGIATIRSADSAASDAVFDLGGKRLDKSQLRKGMVYIIGGKKVLWNGGNE